MVFWLLCVGSPYYFFKFGNIFWSEQQLGNWKRCGYKFSLFPKYCFWDDNSCHHPLSQCHIRLWLVCPLPPLYHPTPLNQASQPFNQPCSSHRLNLTQRRRIRICFCKRLTTKATSTYSFQFVVFAGPFVVSWRLLSVLVVERIGGQTLVCHLDGTTFH